MIQLSSVFVSRRSWLLGLASAWLAGCAGYQKQAIHVRDYPGTIKVACVGDSITWGAGIERREQNCYPAVLGKLLGSRFETRNFGVNGATLLKHGDGPYWKTGAFKEATEFEPDVVILKLGTNDSKPQNWKHKDEFAGDLRAMLDHFAGLRSKPKIWLCLPVPVYAERWGINEPVVRDDIIPIIRQVAKERNLPVIDLHTALSNHPEFFPDQIHPDAAGAALMAMSVNVALQGRY
ncbi:MAG TPA: GDSL-type esterase/lipase family protein [Verrucomicrobiae bacterium]|nr:GDSL-type esterase/lipase family protein [Verrucomicrobiae bacterium]